jgi:hypothetical protein
MQHSPSSRANTPSTSQKLPRILWHLGTLLFSKMPQVLADDVSPGARQLLIIYSAFVKYSRKKWEYNEAVLVDFKKTYGSVRREVLYNILIEFGIHLKLVRLIKMCLNETYSRVRVGKHLSDRFPI